jgi:hypothetical protein
LLFKNQTDLAILYRGLVAELTPCFLFLRKFFLVD